jgi:hypothetical protein
MPELGPVIATKFDAALQYPSYGVRRRAAMEIALPTD